MITTEDIGKPITLTRDTETLTGTLLSIFNSPEIVEQIPGDSQGSFSPVWSAGYRVISIEVPVSTSTANSVILSSIIGVTTYDVKGEEYVIQSIEVDAQKALITLRHNQGATLDANANLTLDLILNSGANSITDSLVKGSNVRVIPLTDSSGISRLKILVYKVYMHSDADILISAGLGSYGYFKGFTLTRNYIKNSTTETETFAVSGVDGSGFYLTPFPAFEVNDREGAEVVEYSHLVDTYLGAPSITRTLTG